LPARDERRDVITFAVGSAAAAFGPLDERVLRTYNARQSFAAADFERGSSDTDHGDEGNGEGNDAHGGRRDD
jgi:hypothetical protein